MKGSATCYIAVAGGVEAAIAATRAQAAAQLGGADGLSVISAVSTGAGAGVTWHREWDVPEPVAAEPAPKEPTEAAPPEAVARPTPAPRPR
jgi:hypothetical protein